MAKRFTLVLIVVLVVIPPFLNLAQGDPGTATLRVSLPAGTVIGADSDPWLNEGWLLNLSGTSWAFIVRVNQTSSAHKCYDTHLIVALNDLAYNNLITLTINGTTIPKAAFQYGTPEPYNIGWTWPDDVYPTWFNDTYINLGNIEPFEYKEVNVSVTFSDSAGARMRFDAYGKDVPGQIHKVGDIIWTPNSEDSTVVSAGAPPGIPPHAEFTYSPAYPIVCENVTFDASGSYDPDGYVVSYTWHFGDGNTTTVGSPIVGHHYATYGNYSVTLEVKDNDTLTDYATATVNVREYPVADFTYSPLTPYTGETITFNATPSYDPDGYIVSYAWDFGDNTTGTGNVTTHSYTDDGTYTATLNVTDNDGLSSSVSANVAVLNKPPVASFTENATTVLTGEAIHFDASSSYDPDGSIITYYWDFGDGNNDTGVSVNHSYSTAGNYTVTLTVTDDDGAIHSVNANKTVLEHVCAYYLTGETDPAGIVTIPGEGWHDNSTDVNLTASTPVSVSPGVQYRFDYWDVDGVSQGSGVNPITVHMDANHTATAHYILQYYLTMSTNFGTSTPGGGWHDAGSTVQINASAPSVVDGERYVWLGWTGTGNGSYSSTDNPASITMNGPITETATWRHEYYLTVTSPYGSPTPTSGWFEAGTSITASVTSPWPGPSGTQYVCTGWTGTGSAPASGTTTTATFTINAPSGITWNWKTQYYLTVKTDPAGIVTIPGEGWHDDSTDVTLTAPTVVNYNFINWNVDGVSQGSGVNPITVHIDGSHTATAHYQAVSPPPAVGGYAVPIDKSCLMASAMGLAPWIGLAFTFLVAMIITIIILIRRGKKIL